MAVYEKVIEDLRRDHPKLPLLELLAQLTMFVLKIQTFGLGRFPAPLRILFIIVSYLVAFLICAPCYLVLCGAVLIGRIAGMMKLPR